MIKRICDICSEPLPWPTKIKRTNKPNATIEDIELCERCLNDIKNYLEEKK